MLRREPGFSLGFSMAHYALKARIKNWKPRWNSEPKPERTTEKIKESIDYASLTTLGSPQETNWLKLDGHFVVWKPRDVWAEIYIGCRKSLKKRATFLQYWIAWHGVPGACNHDGESARTILYWSGKSALLL
jgi:hypothetical protein